MKSKLTKILWNPIAGITYGLIANTVFGMAMYSLKIRYVIPIINRTHITFDSLQNDVNEIKSCYLKKDVEGREVKVSINNNLEGNNVSVFKDNKLGLKFTQVVFLTNPIDFNDFAPTIKLLRFLLTAGGCMFQQFIVPEYLKQDSLCFNKNVQRENHLPQRKQTKSKAIYGIEIQSETCT